MRFRIQSRYIALFVSVLIAAQAKIVYLNGTTVSEDNPQPSNTSISPNWYSSGLFDLRNISNHSAKDQDENPLATRSGKQLQLLSAGQRLLNGMHLAALLAGIYLMIFVVEPVAVPPQYLSQHYYGLPWIQHDDTLLERRKWPAEERNKQWKRNDFTSKPHPQPNVGKKPNPVKHLQMNSSLSRENYSSNKPKSWSQWIPPPNSTNVLLNNSREVSSWTPKY